jgi:hypothetical protein
MWPDVYWRSERYVAMEVDTPGQMNLAFDNRNGTSLGLVGPTVFEVGADDRYIIVKQHPATDGFGHFDRSVTNCFYIERTDSLDFRERQRRVTGPLSEQEFRERAAELKLPSFQKIFRDLQ